jgi:hypothetical protein
MQTCHTLLLHLRAMKAQATCLAAGQDGLLTHNQLRCCGYSNDQIDRLVATRQLERLERELYAVAGAPKTKRQAIRAAVLAAEPNGVASHRCAPEVWGLPGFTNQPVEVSIPHGCDHEFKLGKLHQSCLLPEEHVTVVNGIRVTTPARMLFDLAADLTWKRLERAANSALAMRLVTVVDLRRMLNELGKRGRPGTRRFRLLVEKLERARGHAESGLEDDFLILVTDAGLPEPRLQVDFYDDDGFIGRVDSVWGPQLVIAEVDSDWLHTAPLDEEADALRDKRLRALGYEVVRCSEHQIRRRPEYVVRTLREKLGLPPGSHSRGG